MRKVLIANRGEIAVRIIRACRELGLSTVAVYSDCDRGALHVRLADEARPLGGNAANETYLRIDKLLAAAHDSGADAVHPGYGFLAEHAGFASACREAGLTYIGPSSRAIETMGSKTSARAAALAAGVPVVPGTAHAVDPTDEAGAARTAMEIGYPLLVKAAAGGGGKGMRLIREPSELPGALRAAASEAASSFGDGAVYYERYLDRPRHVEVQLMGDHHGTLVAFVERECSIQRRHQKVVEESPSVAVDAATRRALAEAAVRIARQVNYSNAGTIEFLLAPDGSFYFLEMNTRLQVEHPITEAVTGVDLVHWQIRVADGERLTIDPEAALMPRGHAIEVRIYAEDPDDNFLPSPGRVTFLRTPSGPGIRDDSGIAAPAEVPVYYDPLISKLVVWAADRPSAVRRLARALDEYAVEGVRTTIPFFRWLVQQDDFRAAAVDTAWLDRAIASRPNGSFADAAVDRIELALVAVAVAAQAAASSPGGTAAPRGDAWTAAARREGLR
ncbi:MAG TPA: acetyl-CoA carboxylase biotin carboxylase subunit [Vicinamibacterales bacterium]|nr:acetyl-CoA carboxylase biotin carboxylase subunit [Vicinamibacterales bacterium]